MISLAPEPDLAATVPGADSCAWVKVGRGEEGREELRDKLVMRGDSGEGGVEQDPYLDDA